MREDKEERDLLLRPKVSPQPQNRFDITLQHTKLRIPNVYVYVLTNSPTRYYDRPSDQPT